MFLNGSPKPGIFCVVTREDKLDENKSLLSIDSLKKKKERIKKLEHRKLSYRERNRQASILLELILIKINEKK